jgi:hypothetical protein
MERSGGGKEDMGHWGARGRKYLPFEYTALALLEHMIRNEESGPFTMYCLRKARCIHGQRLDRLLRALGSLVERGWIEPLPGRNTRYRATEEGRMAYFSWVVNYLEFVRSTRIRREPDGQISSSQRLARLRRVAPVMRIFLEDNLDELCSSIAYLPRGEHISGVK